MPPRAALCYFLFFSRFPHGLHAAPDSHVVYARCKLFSREKEALNEDKNRGENLFSFLGRAKIPLNRFNFLFSFREPAGEGERREVPGKCGRRRDTDDLFPAPAKGVTRYRHLQSSGLPFCKNPDAKRLLGPSAPM